MGYKKIKKNIRNKIIQEQSALYFKRLHPSINTSFGLGIFGTKIDKDHFIKSIKKHNIREATSTRATIKRPRTVQEKQDENIKPLLRTISNLFLVQNEGSILPSQLKEIFQENNIEHLAPEYTDEDGLKIPMEEADDVFLKEINNFLDPKNKAIAKKRFKDNFIASISDYKDYDEEDIEAVEKDIENTWRGIQKHSKNYHTLPEIIRNKLNRAENEWQYTMEDTNDDYNEAEKEWKENIDDIRYHHQKITKQLEKEYKKENDPRKRRRKRLKLEQLEQNRISIEDYQKHRLNQLTFEKPPETVETVFLDSEDEKAIEDEPARIISIKGKALSSAPSIASVAPRRRGAPFRPTAVETKKQTKLRRKEKAESVAEIGSTVAPSIALLEPTTPEELTGVLEIKTGKGGRKKIKLSKKVKRTGSGVSRTGSGVSTTSAESVSEKEADDIIKKKMNEKILDMARQNHPEKLEVKAKEITAFQENQSQIKPEEHIEFEKNKNTYGIKYAIKKVLEQRKIDDIIKEGLEKIERKTRPPESVGLPDIPDIPKPKSKPKKATGEAWEDPTHKAYNETVNVRKRINKNPHKFLGIEREKMRKNPDYPPGYVLEYYRKHHPEFTEIRKNDVYKFYIKGTEKLDMTKFTKNEIETNPDLIVLEGKDIKETLTKILEYRKIDEFSEKFISGVIPLPKPKKEPPREEPKKEPPKKEPPKPKPKKEPPKKEPISKGKEEETNYNVLLEVIKKNKTHKKTLDRFKTDINKLPMKEIYKKYKELTESNPNKSPNKLIRKIIDEDDYDYYFENQKFPKSVSNIIVSAFKKM